MMFRQVSVKAYLATLGQETTVQRREQALDTLLSDQDDPDARCNPGVFVDEDGEPLL